MKEESLIEHATSGPFYIENRSNTDKYLIMLREATTEDGRLLSPKRTVLFLDEIAEGRQPIEFALILEKMAARIRELAIDPSRGYRYGISQKS